MESKMDSSSNPHTMALLDISEVLMFPQDDLLLFPTVCAASAEYIAENEEDGATIMVPIQTTPLLPCLPPTPSPWLPPTPSSESVPAFSPSNFVKLSSSPLLPPSNKEPRQKRSKKTQKKLFVPKYLKDPTNPTLTVKERASVKKSITCKGHRVKKAEEMKHLKEENGRLNVEMGELKTEIERLNVENEELKNENLQFKAAQKRDHAEIVRLRQVVMQLSGN